EANALAGADTIIVPAGTYTLTLAGTDEDFAETGDLDILEDLTIVGAGASTTIVDGGALDRVFDIQSSGPVTISGLTIRHGFLNDPTTSSGDIGAGILVASFDTTTLADCIVTGNSAVNDAGGGGIFVFSPLTMTRVTVSNNSALVGTGVVGEGG